MKSSEVSSDLVFVGSRVSSFNLTTNKINKKGQPVDVSFDYDYNIQELQHEGSNSFGVIEFIVHIKATVKKKVLFKLDLVMEGAFKSESLDEAMFKQMVELNGLVTLSQMSRSYIQSVTAQSGINPPVKMPLIDINRLIELKNKDKETSGH
ncbi:MAG: preprotein translocase subunit SecB [Bacillota bacterium]